MRNFAKRNAYFFKTQCVMLPRNANHQTEDLAIHATKSNGWALKQYTTQPHKDDYDE